MKAQKYNRKHQGVVKKIMKQELRIRYEWLQPSGRPQKPEWTRHVQSIELMQDETYVEDEGSKMQLASG